MDSDVRRVLVGIIRTCHFYGPDFPIIDISITMDVREYTITTMNRVESSLLRIFTHFLGNDFFNLNVYYSVESGNENEYMMNDYNVFISSASLTSFL